MMENKFHLSVPCKNIQKTRRFYEKLGFDIGRNRYNWFDVNLFGNQVTFTFDENLKMPSNSYEFDNMQLPHFHFGVIVSIERWTLLYNEFENEDFFAIGATNFLSGKKGEHQSFFLKDPNGYFLEFKTFTESDDVFDSDDPS